MANFSRRLPVYLLIDTSGSMYGEPIEAVRQGIKALLMELRTDPQALETAYLSVITFNSSAVQQCPLTELIAFKEPQIEATGLTSLGAGLELLSECIEHEVIKNSPTVKGDWRPLVFILTDGVPTDTWEEQARRLKADKPANIIACGAGADASIEVLKQITDNVIMLNNLSAGDLSQFFKWVSDSIKLSSNALDAKPDQPIDLPAPPPAFTIIP